MVVTTVSKNEKDVRSSSPRYIGEILFQLDDTKEKARLGLVDDVNYGIGNVRQISERYNVGIEESYFDNIIKEAYTNWANYAVSSARRSADIGMVEDTKMYLSAAVKTADNFGLVLPDQQMKDIMRTAYKLGAEKEMLDSKTYSKAGDIPLAVRCLDYADHYSDEMNGCQRALRDIKPTLIDRIVYRYRYGRASDDDIQKVFDSVGRKYDNETWWESRRKKRDIYNMRINLFNQAIKGTKQNSHKLPSLHYKMPSIFKRPKPIPAPNDFNISETVNQSKKPFTLKISERFRKSTMYKILSS